MDVFDAVWNAVKFVEEACVSYASTPAGQTHLQKVASDLGLSADDLQAISDSVTAVEEVAPAVKSHFNDSRKGG